MNESFRNSMNGALTSHHPWRGMRLRGGVTPVPNRIFDELIPSLTDTQLRVLLVVVRSTLGWQDAEGRKMRDWLSHRQLQARTGRAGAAVSGAIDVLVNRGLLEVQDRSGEVKTTASARRAARGPLFYRLREVTDSMDYSSQNEVAPNRQLRGAPDSLSSQVTESKFETEAPKSDSTSERRLHKTKTTKERETKERKNNTEISFDLSSLGSKVLRISEEQIAQLQGISPKSFTNSEVGGADAKFSEVSELPVPATHFGKVDTDSVGLSTVEIPNDETDAFICLFEIAYSALRGQTCPPVEIEDRELLGRYLETYGAPLLERWLPAFFASDFGYVRRRSWSLKAYLNAIFILQAQKKTIGDSRRSMGCSLAGKVRAENATEQETVNNPSRLISSKINAGHQCDF